MATSSLMFKLGPAATNNQGPHRVSQSWNINNALEEQFWPMG